jgi:hypothetical protein
MGSAEKYLGKIKRIVYSKLSVGRKRIKSCIDKGRHGQTHRVLEYIPQNTATQFMYTSLRRVVQDGLMTYE